MIDLNSLSKNQALTQLVGFGFMNPYSLVLSISDNSSVTADFSKLLLTASIHVTLCIPFLYVPKYFTLLYGNAIHFPSEIFKFLSLLIAEIARYVILDIHFPSLLIARNTGKNSQTSPRNLQVI